jgi:hypothetical protein
LKSSAAERKEIGTVNFSVAEAESALNAIRTELDFLPKMDSKTREFSD